MGNSFRQNSKLNQVLGMHSLNTWKILFPLVFLFTPVLLLFVRLRKSNFCRNQNRMKQTFRFLFNEESDYKWITKRYWLIIWPWIYQINVQRWKLRKTKQLYEQITNQKLFQDKKVFFWFGIIYPEFHWDTAFFDVLVKERLSLSKIAIRIQLQNHKIAWLFYDLVTP